MLAIALYGCSDEQGVAISSEAGLGTLDSNSQEQVGGTPQQTPAPVQQPEPVTQPQPEPVAQPQPEPVAQPQPEPVAQPQPEPVAQPEPAPLPQGSFDVSVSSDTNNLIEGDDNGMTVIFNINRRDGHQSPLNVVVREIAANRQEALRVDMTGASLSGSENNATARISLPIATGPITPHQRNLSFEVSDGQNIFTNEFVINVQPVPAPDIYLLIGQSNMIGTTEFGARQRAPGLPDELNARIDQLNVRQNNDEMYDTAARFTDEGFNVMDPTFHIAEDPLHQPRFPGRTEKDGSQIGVGLTFAKSMLPFTTQKIILVPAAWSASSFCRSSNPLLGWNSAPIDDPQFGNTLLLDRAIVRMNVALRESGGIFRGILWHQGESDSNDLPCAERYEANLTGLVNAIRVRTNQDRRGPEGRGLNAPIPFVAGTMSMGDDQRGEFSILGVDKQMVDAAHRNIGNVVPFAGTMVADDLVPPAYPCGANSCVHFGSTAIREMGFRYHQVMQSIIDSTRNQGS